MAQKIEWLIAGLGNPGKIYVNNRHNIGWMVATEFSNRHKKPMMAMSNIYYQAVMRVAGKLVMTIMPTTYMNGSGEAVSKVAKQYDIPPDRIIAITDEYNFPVGKIHIRKGGGDGGHNGIASVIDWMETTDYYRLRCGIGNDFGPGGMVDYVLSDFPEEQSDEISKMIVKACEALDTMVAQPAGKAMSLINSGKLWEKPEDKDEKVAEENKNNEENEKINNKDEE